MELKRSSGILLHPTSLPGKYGIGSLGREAFKFIDFLVHSGQQIWQILPLGPTGYGNSPYQCYSAIAGNPLLIDIDYLIEQGWIAQKDANEHSLFRFDDAKVNYDDVSTYKYLLLHKAYYNFTLSAAEVEQNSFENFCRENVKWLDDYSLFMALKSHFDESCWNTWEPDLKLRKREVLKKFKESLAEEIGYQQFIQYLFFMQWRAVKDYANSLGIKIIGDIPLYVSYDSVDAWIHPEMFLFDRAKNPILVAGVPPDYFSETGQLWGNPIYNWPLMEKDNFRWWIERIKLNLKLYDIIRIDHFRGLSAYWAIPFGEETAINGKWIDAPGKAFFKTLKYELGDLSIIAEDLGVMTEDVEELRDSFGLPGMKILQFAFDSAEENDYLPHTFNKNCIVYTGTHDNNTVLGWYNAASVENKQYVCDYLNAKEDTICWDFIRAAYASVANLVIIPIQDILELEEDARMNTPGTTADNWVWRMTEGHLTKRIEQKLKHLTLLYCR